MEPARCFEDTVSSPAAFTRPLARRPASPFALFIYAGG